jgi:hypothetical protein
MQSVKYGIVHLCGKGLFAALSVASVFACAGNAAETSVGESNSNATNSAEHHAVLEPPAGRVIYNIGQDDITMEDTGTSTYGLLTQVFDGIEQIAGRSGARPMFKHMYVGDYDGSSTSTFTFERKLEVLDNFNSTYSHKNVPFISFKFKNEATLDAFFSGQYDAYFKSVGERAAKDGRAFFFRPFYEFNKYGDHDGVLSRYAVSHPEKTKQQWLIEGFRKFYDLVRNKRNAKNVAFVWCLLGSDAEDYKTFYPGNDVVDWVGIDLFSKHHLALAAGIAKWVSENTDNKPIFLPEVQPALDDKQEPAVGGTRNPEKVVSEFFNPLFGFIEKNPNVKGLTYMNLSFPKLAKDDPARFGWVASVGLDKWHDGRVQPLGELKGDNAVFELFAKKVGDSSRYLYEGQDATLLR